MDLKYYDLMPEFVFKRWLRAASRWRGWTSRHGGQRWPLRLPRMAYYYAMMPIRRLYQCGWCGERYRSCVCDETFLENTAFLILDELLPRIASGEDRVTVIGYACGLDPDAWERHMEYQKRCAELAAASGKAG